ncbi:MAG: DUF6503 family protein [Bacteroidota bacterium]
MRFFVIFLGCALLLGSCDSPPATSTPETEAVVAVLPTPEGLLGESLAAHGGLDQWRKFGTLELSLNNGAGTSTDQILTDLHTRHELITGEEYAIGFDGETYWQTRVDTAQEPKNARFYINLQFYFFAMPFVLADPGVVVQELGQREIAGNPYEVVQAGFEDGVGVAPKDQYLLYLDPETKQLAYLLYSVTYFNEEHAERYNALHYAEWQEVDGLVVPSRIDRYRWEAEAQTLGEARGAKYYPEVKFSGEAVPASTFTPPVDAMIAE